MRARSFLQTGPVLLAAAVLASGCGSSNDEGGAPTTMPGPAPIPTMAVPGTVPSQAELDAVTVVSDITYAAPVANALEPALDVYSPPGAQGLPLVVLFHGGGSYKTGLAYPALARNIAARGAVVAVPNNGPANGALSGDIAEAVEENTAYKDAGACAVSFAVAHAGEWGASTSGDVVLFGHSGGANMASVLAFDRGRAVGDCMVAATPWTPVGLLLWDGELALLDPSMWTQYGDSVDQLFDSLTPWNQLDAGLSGKVQFVATAAARGLMRRCDTAAEWANLRDPTGQFLADLESAGALTDGCVDIGEVSLTYAVAMERAGISVSTVALEENGTTHATPALGDLQRLAQLTIDLTRA